MIYSQTSLESFIDAFKRFNRADNFSLSGLKSLYTYLNDNKKRYIY